MAAQTHSSRAQHCDSTASNQQTLNAKQKKELCHAREKDPNSLGGGKTVPGKRGSLMKQWIWMIRDLSRQWIVMLGVLQRRSATKLL
jgi:hypothetical protein